MPRALSFVPLVFACTLLVAAAQPPATRTAPGSGPAASTTTSSCSSTLQSGGLTTALPMSMSLGVTQPLIDGPEDVVGSSLDFPLSSYGWGEMDHEIVAWDPVALAPDPTTVALRTSAFNLSAYNVTAMTATYYPALIRRQVATVAEPIRSTLALDWNIPVWYSSGTAHYDSAGTAGVPVALHYTIGGARTPLAGPHPVLTHTVCTGDSALGALSVVQSVTRCDSLTDATTTDMIQAFRVPVPTRLHWIECAEAATPVVNGNLLGIVSVIDATGPGAPPLYPPEPMVQGYLPFFSYGVPQWLTHLDFDQTITLVPAHDYWLRLHPNGSHRFYTRMRTGTENANFTSHIGTLWQLTPQGAGWDALPDRVLDFRLIGEVLGTTDVPVGDATAGRLQLRALANPARGSVAFAWSGARGALRLEVLDVRGRRVGAGETAALAAGSWLWSARQPDGRSLGAGVYFVHATDAAGRTATERVVLVH